MSVVTDTVDSTLNHSYLAEVFISLKPVVNDPEGLSIRAGLHSLGYAGVESVRAGKYLRLTVSATSREEAEAEVARMCEQLLANPVMETFRVTMTALADH